MRINRNIWPVIGVAALAFVAGRLDLLSGGFSATAGPPDEYQEMTAEMEAMMKAGMPGPHHAHLKQLDGKWEGVFRMWSPAGDLEMEAPGTIDRTWVLDGRYLREDIEAVTEMGTFHGVGYTGFNNVDGRYEAVWMDSMSSAIMTSTGSYDAGSKIWSFGSSHRDPATGHLMSVRSTLDTTNPNRHVYRDYVTGPDGKEYKAFEGISERVE